MAERLGGGLQNHPAGLDSPSSVQIMPCWWNGRHTALRTQRRKVYGFESCAGYQILSG